MTAASDAMAATQSRPRPARFSPWAMVTGSWKFLLGLLFCLSPVSALLVAGWLMRWMQRESLCAWAGACGGSIADASGPLQQAADGAGIDLQSWPNWILHRNPLGQLRQAWPSRSGMGAGIAMLSASLFGSLWDNLRLGLQATANIVLLTLPVSTLWIFAWWAGWENSFNKGYEQFEVGPTVALSGVALFLLVMTYLPLASARQAVNGCWRAFYDYRVVRTLVRRRPISALGLALLYALAGLPLLAVKVLPVFVEAFVPDFPTLDPAGIESLASRVTLATAAYVFLASILLRRAAARLYAVALLEALGKGALMPEALRPLERELLQALELLQENPKRTHSHLTRFLLWTSGSLARALVWTLCVLAWFLLVAQIFVGQFANHDWLHWLLHPLVQLPWYRTVIGG